MSVRHGRSVHPHVGRSTPMTLEASFVFEREREGEDEAFEGAYRRCKREKLSECVAPSTTTQQRGEEAELNEEKRDENDSFMKSGEVVETYRPVPNPPA